MNSFIRVVVILLPLATILAGCGKPQRARSIRKGQHAGQKASSADHKLDRERSTAHANPSRSRDGRYDITLAQIRAHQKAGSAVMIDARDPAQFSMGHLRGAINLPAGAPVGHLSRLLEGVPSNELLIIYCYSSFCEASNIIYDFLLTQGYTNLRIYKPGWAVLSLADVERSRE